MRKAAFFFFSLLGLMAGLRAQEPMITAECAILFDANTGKVIYKKNENERRPVASTQKLLTALIIAESGELSAPVIIEVHMLAAPTKLYLKTGDTHATATAHRVAHQESKRRAGPGETWKHHDLPPNERKDGVRPAGIHRILSS